MKFVHFLNKVFYSFIFISYILTSDIREIHSKSFLLEYLIVGEQNLIIYKFLHQKVTQKKKHLLINSLINIIVGPAAHLNQSHDFYSEYINKIHR